MGYDVHITRADDWAESEGCEITVAAWHDVIAEDGELRLADNLGPHVAIWDGHPGEGEIWFDWRDGNITTKNPDEPLLGKMLEIAARLDATVQGDDGEVYPLPALRKSIWPGAPVLALVLAIVAALALSIVIPLDSRLRETYPLGTPMPTGWASVLACTMGVAAISWFVGGIFAVAALFFRQTSWQMACVALGINCVSAAVVLFTN